VGFAQDPERDGPGAGTAECQNRSAYLIEQLAKAGYIGIGNLPGNHRQVMVFEPAGLGG
jgi:hypothetical protein